MSLLFDETNDYLLVADDAALTLPDADWSVGGWIKLTDNVGTGYQYFLSWGGWSAIPSLNWWFVEASAGSNPNKLGFYAVDNDSTGSGEILTSGTPGTSTAWQHLLLVRSGTTITQYVNASADGSYTSASFDAVNRSDGLYLGARSDLNSTRFLGGQMAEWAKWDRVLGADEIAALAAGLAPAFLPRGLAWYLPMLGEAVERVAGLGVTTSGPVVAEHPPRIVYPVPARLCEAASGGVRPAQVFQSPVVSSA